MYVLDLSVRAGVQRLPDYKDSVDSMDTYLERFERFAPSQKWDRTTLIIYISALLTSQALEVYFRIASSDALDYDKLKRHY